MLTKKQLKELKMHAIYAAEKLGFNVKDFFIFQEHEVLSKRTIIGTSNSITMKPMPFRAACLNTDGSTLKMVDNHIEGTLCINMLYGTFQGDTNNTKLASIEFTADVGASELFKVLITYES